MFFWWTFLRPLLDCCPNPCPCFPPLIVSTCFWCHHRSFVSEGLRFKGALSQIHHCFNCSWGIGKQTQPAVGGFHCQSKRKTSEVGWMSYWSKILSPWCPHPSSTMWGRWKWSFWWNLLSSILHTFALWPQSARLALVLDSHKLSVKGFTKAIFWTSENYSS